MLVRLNSDLHCKGHPYRSAATAQKVNLLSNFRMTLKTGFGKWSFVCFISQWMKRLKHGLFVFPPKKTLIWKRHYSIDHSCCSMTSKRSND